MSGSNTSVSSRKLREDAATDLSLAGLSLSGLGLADVTALARLVDASLGSIDELEANRSSV